MTEPMTDAVHRASGKRLRSGAQLGNRNAAKPLPGLTGQFYLNAAERAVLTAEIERKGEEATEAAIRLCARDLLQRAIRDVAQAQERTEAIML